MLLDNDFIYYHIPYVGLGINTVQTDSGLTITSVSPFRDNKSSLLPGDVIFEINNNKINNINTYNIENIINGSEKDSIKISYIRNNTVNTATIKLSKQQYKQNSNSFINDIKNYGEKWFEYDLDILEIFSKKNKFVIYYEWEGTLIKSGPTYSFRAMEIIKIESSNNRIKSIDALWSEKQFKNQFISIP
tara:strand:- start:506 stop:1072 length:567 start_codon:yes stop_codon:yes gene_type:complete